MPTNPERMVWGTGDASGLRTVDTPVGRIGTPLICWENYMPLSRTHCMPRVDIYIATTYDSGDDWLCNMQHIAREAGCWVINSGNLPHATDMPDDLEERATLYPDADEWVNSGDSAVIVTRRTTRCRTTSQRRRHRVMPTSTSNVRPQHAGH